MTTVENPAGFAAWPALGMLVQLVVTDPPATVAAQQLLEADLDALDRACSRFRSDSELIAVGNAARGSASAVTVTVSPLLAEAVAVALRAAQLSDGDVDPTVGGVLADLGYDRDFAQLTPADPLDRGPGGSPAVGVRGIPGGRSVRVDVAAGRAPRPA